MSNIENEEYNNEEISENKEKNNEEIKENSKNENEEEKQLESPINLNTIRNELLSQIKQLQIQTEQKFEEQKD